MGAHPLPADGGQGRAQVRLGRWLVEIQLGQRVVPSLLAQRLQAPVEDQLAVVDDRPDESVASLSFDALNREVNRWPTRCWRGEWRAARRSCGAG